MAKTSTASSKKPSKKAKRLGGTTIIPKQEVPGMGWFAWLGDPEGNVIGLWTPLAGG